MHPSLGKVNCHFIIPDPVLVHFLVDIHALDITVPNGWYVIMSKV